VEGEGGEVGVARDVTEVRESSAGKGKEDSERGKRRERKERDLINVCAHGPLITFTRSCITGTFLSE